MWRCLHGVAKVNDPVADLSARFRWRRMWLRGLRILRAPGPVEGDCKAFALTVAWLMAGRSGLRMAWHLLTFRTVIWFAWAGEFHACTWVHRRGWTCNIVPAWRDRCPHLRLLPLHPIVLALPFIPAFI